MIHYSTSRTYKNVDAPSQCMCLIVDIGAAVHTEDGVLVGMMLELGKGSSNLNSKLTGWSQDNRLRTPCLETLIRSQVLNDWKSECERLSGTGQVTDDQVLPIINILKRAILHWKQTDNSCRLQYFDRLLRDLWEVGEVAGILRSDLLLLGRIPIRNNFAIFPA